MRGGRVEVNEWVGGWRGMRGGRVEADKGWEGGGR